uniref:Response regulator n=1 Tax=Desulfobacca acetoxidans TaxID=60893 RepID=A0A7C3UXM1_9BACT
MKTPTMQILLVDDDRHIRSLGQELLEKLGYAVETAADGEEVLEMLHQGRPLDLVILDYHLPGMSGLEEMRNLKRIQPKAEVLVASGFFSNREKEQLMAGGARGFLDKPFRLGELKSRIEELLEERSGARP